MKWLLATIVLVIYAGNKYRAYNRLKSFKGPFSTGFSELWHSLVMLGCRSHLVYDKVCQKYGPIARLGPNDLITSSPELIAHMNAVRSPYTRTFWFYRGTRFEPGKDHVFSQLDEEKHNKRRQQMASGYSGKENLALESSIDARLLDLIHLIRSKYVSSDTPMDLARKVQYFTLDVISEIGFGQTFGDLKADADLNDYAKSSEEGLFALTVAASLGLNWLLHIPWVGRLVGPSEKDKTGFGKMMSTARILVDERVKSSTDTRSDMLASFIRHGMSKEDIFSESLLQILAGSDTTATAIRGITLYLFTHPRAYTKLQTEIDTAVKEGRAPISPKIISDAESRNLEYLQAVIKEGIRMYPPVTDLLSKCVPDGGDTVVVEGKSIFLPGGTNVGYAAWPMHRSKEVYGEDADVFRPERWLLEDNEKNREKIAAMNRTSEMIFGYGRYQCLGKPIARMELGKAIFELMRNFDWGLVNPETPWKMTNYLGIFEHSDMWVQVADRG